MEFFNNIWVALSTPNTELLNILFIPTSFLEYFLSMNIFMNILNISTSSYKKALYVILMSVTSLLTLNFIQNPFNILINYTAMILFICILFKCGFFKGFIATISSILVYGIVLNAGAWS